MKNYVNDNAIIPFSVYDAIMMIQDNDTRRIAFETLILNALTDELNLTNNPVVDMVLTMARPLQVSTKQRYKKAVENGKLGGRPIKVDREKVFELRKNGYTQNQIASELGCGIRTVRNVLNDKPAITGNNLDIDIDKEKENEVEVDRDTDSDTDVEVECDISDITYDKTCHNLDVDKDVDKDKDTDVEVDTYVTTEPSGFDTTSTTTTTPASDAALSSNRKFTGDVLYNLIRIFGKEQYYEETKAKYIKWVNRAFPNISNYDLELLTCSLISLRTRNFPIERTSDSDSFSYWVIDALNHVKKNNILTRYRNKIIAEREQEEGKLSAMPETQEITPKYNSSLELEDGSKKVINASDYYSDDTDDDGFPF